MLSLRSAGYGLMLVPMEVSFPAMSEEMLMCIPPGIECCVVIPSLPPLDISLPDDLTTVWDAPRPKPMKEYMRDTYKRKRPYEAGTNHDPETVRNLETVSNIRKIWCVFRPGNETYLLNWIQRLPRTAALTILFDSNEDRQAMDSATYFKLTHDFGAKMCLNGIRVKPGTSARRVELILQNR